MIEILFIMGVILPCVTITSLIADQIWDSGAYGLSKIKRSRDRTRWLATLPNAVRTSVDGLEKSAQSRWLKVWNSYIETRIKKSNLKIDTFTYTIIIFVLAIAGILVGLAIFKNITIASIATITFILVPLQIIEKAAYKYDERIENQLPLAIQLFVTELEGTNNVREALARAAKGVNYPLRSHLNQCVRDLGVSRMPEKAFYTLGTKINSQILFCNLEQSPLTQNLACNYAN